MLFKMTNRIVDEIFVDDQGISQLVLHKSFCGQEKRPRCPCFRQIIFQIFRKVKVFIIKTFTLQNFDFGIRVIIKQFGFLHIIKFPL